MSGIHMALLGSTRGATFRIDSGTYTDFAIDPLDAQTTLSVGSTGLLEVSGSNSGVFTSYDWITPTAGSTSYFVRLAPSSGSFSGDTTNVWLALSSSRQWFVNQTGLGLNAATGTLAIATDSGGSNIVVSAALTLRAQVDL